MTKCVAIVLLPDWIFLQLPISESTLRLSVTFTTPLTAHLRSEIMSEAEPQSRLDIESTEVTVVESVDASPIEPLVPHGEHEAEITGVDTPAESPLNPVTKNGDSNANGTEPPHPDDSEIVDDATGSAPVHQDKNEDPTTITGSGKPKPGMSVKTTGSKPAGPPTPLVKKVCLTYRPLPSS